MASAIREIFKLIDKQDVISFAAGIPAPELFPAKEWAKITSDILNNAPAGALIYGVTEGYAPLREVTKERTRRLGAFGDGDELVMTTGAQQAIDLTAEGAFGGRRRRYRREARALSGRSTRSVRTARSSTTWTSRTTGLTWSRWKHF